MDDQYGPYQTEAEREGYDKPLPKKKVEFKQYQKDFKRIMSLTPVKLQDACLDEYCVKHRDTGKVLGPVLSERVQGNRTNKEAVLSFVFNNEGILIGAEVYVPSMKETFSFIQNATDELE